MQPKLTNKHHVDSWCCRNKKVTPEPVFHKFLTQTSGSGSEKKTQNPAGVNSGTPGPWPPLVYSTSWSQTRSQVSRFGGAKYIFRGQDFCYYFMFRKFLSHNKIWRHKQNWGHWPRMPPHGYRPAWSIPILLSAKGWILLCSFLTSFVCSFRSCPWTIFKRNCQIKNMTCRRFCTLSVTYCGSKQLFANLLSYFIFRFYFQTALASTYISIFIKKIPSNVNTECS